MTSCTEMGAELTGQSPCQSHEMAMDRPFAQDKFTAKVSGADNNGSSPRLSR